ncbi:MAG: hypothetical protein Q9193_005089, partial [Seirophora villosa]
YDLTETERQPILQAEALKEKDKAIASLRNELQLLQGQPRIKMEPRDDDASMEHPHRMPVASITSNRPAHARAQHYQAGAPNDSIYFGTPGTTSVVEQFANLSVNAPPANLTHLVPRGTDMVAFQIQPTNPFPTFWRAAESTATLINLLPKDHQEIFFYVRAFQRRGQSCSFPHLPDDFTEVEVQRFLGNVKENSEQHPEMLALLFATLAQGIQSGVYDKYGGAWHAGVMDSECRLANAFIAASMQCLRLASFYSRPKLLTIQTLVMLGPYLTNSGRFLDAWALFGTTIRLAQGIGRKSLSSMRCAEVLTVLSVHRDPDLLNPPVPGKEAATRRNLWWWIMHMDQQYAVTLGRPLGISSMGDCPAPEPLVQDPLVQSLSNYISQFTILTRQILSTGYLGPNQIDDFTEQLFALKHSLPTIIQFDETWLDVNKPVPGWPLNMQAATLHAKTHTYILLLNRQRTSGESSQQTDHTNAINYSSRGRRRVLQSCRAILQVFDFFHTREQAGLVCWTIGQQAFNAAMLLVLAMLETNEATDLDAVQGAYSAFLDMQRLGIHRLAEAAVDQLGSLMKEVPSGQVPNETVMGQSGMMLLEDPGLQGFLDSGFSPSNFPMAANPLPPDRPRKQRRTATSNRDHEDVDVKPGVAVGPSKHGSQRKVHAARGTKPKSGQRSSRPTVRQRHSGLPSPSMTEPSDRLHLPPDITQWPLETSSLTTGDLNHRVTCASPPLISPSQPLFQGYPTNEFDSPAPVPHHARSFTGISRAQTAFPEGSRGYPPSHQSASDLNVQPVVYSTQITPHNLTPTDLTPTEMASGGFQTSPRLEFGTYGHYSQAQMHHQAPLNTPPFAAAFTSGEIPCSYPGGNADSPPRRPPVLIDTEK